MVLTELQRRIMRHLAANRSELSYVAGGTALNRDWPRVSDDIDIFHDTDEAIWPSAQADIEALRTAGLHVRVEIEAYGIVEALVRDGMSETIIQWMSESRRRYLPIVRDAEWGARLHPADLAVNKVIAASTRRKARDAADLVAIGQHYCPLAPLVMAAAGKPPFFAPHRTIEGIRRHAASFWDEDFAAVRGLPANWTPTAIRERLSLALDEAEAILDVAPVALIGCLALGADSVPLIPTSLADVTLRRPTSEPDAMPEIKDQLSDWGRRPT